MTKELKPLLRIREEYGFQREVKPSVVLGDFLSQFWGDGDKKEHERLTFFLLGEHSDVIKQIQISRYKNREHYCKTLRSFLKQTLCTNLDSIQKYEKMDKKEKEKRKSSILKNVTYNPLNRRLISKTSSVFQLGSEIYWRLQKAMDSDDFDKLRIRLKEIESYKEPEEEIIQLLFQWNSKDSKPNDPDNKIKEEEEKGKQELAKSFKPLFKQFGDDLTSFIKLDIKSFSKVRFLNYLERLVNLYTLLYYLSIIGGDKNERPLILPVCSNEPEADFRGFADECLQIYRQKAIQFWWRHIHDRVKYDAKILGCTKFEALEIFNKFKEKDNEVKIFTYSTSVSKKRLSKSIIEELGLLESASNLSPTEKFAEAFLRYNSKASRTIARLRILDWQGPGAGLVAPETGRRKHFHLKPDLLEVLVILFVSRNRKQPLKLSLREFVEDLRKRYGIIIGYTEGLESALRQQEMPLPSRSLLNTNLNHLINMLRNLNMLESLSDTAMFIRCPFLWEEQ